MPQHELLACAQCGCFAFSCFEGFAIRVNFLAGQVKDTGNQTSGISIYETDFTEIEFAIQANLNATDDATYCFRMPDPRPTSRIRSMRRQRSENPTCTKSTIASETMMATKARPLGPPLKTRSSPMFQS